MGSSLKRHAPSEFDDIDSENIDPNMLSSPSKKPHRFDFDMTKSSQTPLFALMPTTKPTQYVERAQAAGQKQKANDSTTPHRDALSNKRVQPSSAPAPAGRSPKSKKSGILSRRRMTASPFTRINPPTFSTNQVGTGMSLSIDAALAGTVPVQKSKSKSAHRKNWQFEILEETEMEQAANIIDFRANGLDISDDESRAAAKEDKDNKENIPPVDGAASVRYSSQLTSRRDMMTDEPRNPLGDLVTEDYYAEGCDAASAFIIDSEVSVDSVEEKCTPVSNLSDSCSPSRLRANAMTHGKDEWRNVISKFVPGGSLPAEESQLHPSNSTLELEASDIQIWESESAKADNDEDDQEPLNVGVSQQSVVA